jgi:hypothetical protein
MMGKKGGVGMINVILAGFFSLVRPPSHSYAAWAYTGDTNGPGVDDDSASLFPFHFDENSVFSTK